MALNILRSVVASNLSIVLVNIQLAENPQPKNRLCHLHVNLKLQSVSQSCSMKILSVFGLKSEG